MKLSLSISAEFNASNIQNRADKRNTEEEGLTRPLTGCKRSC